MNDLEGLSRLVIFNFGADEDVLINLFGSLAGSCRLTGDLGVVVASIYVVVLSSGDFKFSTDLT